MPPHTIIVRLAGPDMPAEQQKTRDVLGAIHANLAALRDAGVTVRVEPVRNSDLAGPGGAAIERRLTQQGVGDLPAAITPAGVVEGVDAIFDYYSAVLDRAAAPPTPEQTVEDFYADQVESGWEDTKHGDKDTEDMNAETSDMMAQFSKMAEKRGLSGGARGAARPGSVGGNTERRDEFDRGERSERSEPARAPISFRRDNIDTAEYGETSEQDDRMMSAFLENLSPTD